jgi:hypothetical protein
VRSFKMTRVEDINIMPSGGSAGDVYYLNDFNVNDPHDPMNVGVDNQPIGWDIVSALYKRARVLKSAWKSIVYAHPRQDMDTNVVIRQFISTDRDNFSDSGFVNATGDMSKQWSQSRFVPAQLASRDTANGEHRYIFKGRATPKLLAPPGSRTADDLNITTAADPSASNYSGPTFDPMRELSVRILDSSETSTVTYTCVTHIWMKVLFTQPIERHIDRYAVDVDLALDAQL